jgi:hypothetical protein
VCRCSCLKANSSTEDSHSKCMTWFKLMTDVDQFTCSWWQGSPLREAQSPTTSSFKEYLVSYMTHVLHGPAYRVSCVLVIIIKTMKHVSPESAQLSRSTHVQANRSTKPCHNKAVPMVNIDLNATRCSAPLLHSSGT